MSGFGGKFGTSPAEDGVNAKSDTGYGVAAVSQHNDGVIGESHGINSAGVRGVYHEPNAVDPKGGHLSSDTKVQRVPVNVAFFNPNVTRPGSAVLGIHLGKTAGHGVRGESDFGDGVWGATGAADKTGVFGWNAAMEKSPADVTGGNGVYGLSAVPNASGVYGEHYHGGVGVAGYSINGIGIQGGGKIAAEFNGPVKINGNTSIKGSLSINDVEIPGTVKIGRLTLDGEFDWNGPPELTEQARQGLIHIQGGIPGLLDPSVVGSPNWFQRVDAALRLLDFLVDNAGNTASQALQRAEIANQRIMSLPMPR